MRVINKKLLIAIPLIIAIFISAFVALRFAHAQTDAMVSLEPPSIDTAVCGNFTVDVVIVEHSFPLIYDYDFFLQYDSTQMTPVNAWDAGYLQPNVNFKWEVLPDWYGPGFNAVHCWAVTDDGGSSGPGILATIAFHCDAPGNSSIILEEICLSDESGACHYPEILNAICTVTQFYNPAHTYIDPPDYTVPICVPFKVHVKVKDVTNLHGYSMSLSYDTTYVDCLDIVDACFLPSPKSQTGKTIDDVLGTIDFSYQSHAEAGVSGDGALATITFHCTGAGQSILNIDSISLWDPAGFQIPTTTAGGRVIQIGYWEPLKLQHIVEWPYPYYMVDIPFVPPSSPEGYVEVMAELEAKGFVFDPTMGTATEVTMFIEDEELTGVATSWWSDNTLEDGTRACMLSYQTEDSEDLGMAMGFVTNLLGPEQIPEVDPYIIVNAQPYLFINFYWWSWYPIGRVVTWPYWWYDSHSHKNWFWGPYWWWRSYVKSYYYPYIDIPYWRPWWGWWWHWTYWRHWYWWCTLFPYDP